MIAHTHYNSGTPGWLAFELSVLRRLNFKSVALPLSGEPHLGLALKRWGYRVAANDPAPWAWVKALAFVENNTDPLTETDVETVLQDAYVPGYKPANPSLRNWFNETDAWWFDNVRRNVDKLSQPTTRALAMATALATGDYALSFGEDTRVLRQPLSKIFRRIWQAHPPLVNNSQRNTSSNQEAREFTARQQTDLYFLRLPPPRLKGLSLAAWRDAWVSGPDAPAKPRPALHIETKQQYLQFVEDLLHTANHLSLWAIAHIEDGFVSTSELVETIKRVRPVDTVFSKDLSELNGVRTAIVTA
jgi:hypothetical protein